MAKKEKKIDNETKKIILEDGAKSEFWLIIKKELEENLSSIRQSLKAFPGGLPKSDETPAEEYKVQHMILKWREDNLINLKDLPEVLIMEINNSSDDSDVEKSFDPYHPTEE